MSESEVPSGGHRSGSKFFYTKQYHQMDPSNNTQVAETNSIPSKDPDDSKGLRRVVPHNGSAPGPNSAPIYWVEHLATMPMGKDSGIKWSVDGIRKLRHMERTGAIWAQPMSLRLKPDCLEVEDENKELVERFMLNLVSDPTAHLSHEPRDLYNNILAFVVLVDTKQPGSSNKNPELHMFQCDRVSAQVVADDITCFLTGRQSDVVGGRRDEGFSVQANKQTTVNSSVSSVPLTEAEMYRSGTRMARDKLQPPSAPLFHEDISREFSVDIAEVFERDVNALNHCFDEIERFVALIQQAAHLQRQREAKLQQSKRTKNKKDKHNNNNNIPPVPLPLEQEFVEAFQKFKLSFNLLAKLRNHIHQPNAPELLHFLFHPLTVLLDAARWGMGDSVGPRVVVPLLTLDACSLMASCLTSQETEVWIALGDTWRVPEEQWSPSRPMPPPFYPVFGDGFVPYGPQDHQSACGIPSEVIPPDAPVGPKAATPRAPTSTEPAPLHNTLPQQQQQPLPPQQRLDLERSSEYSNNAARPSTNGQDHDQSDDALLDLDRIELEKERLEFEKQRLHNRERRLREEEERVENDRRRLLEERRRLIDGAQQPGVPNFNERFRNPTMKSASEVLTPEQISHSSRPENRDQTDGHHRRGSPGRTRTRSVSGSRNQPNPVDSSFSTSMTPAKSVGHLGPNPNEVNGRDGRPPNLRGGHSTTNLPQHHHHHHARNQSRHAANLPPVISPRQATFIADMMSRSSTVVRASHDRTGVNQKELSIYKGEHLEVLSDKKQWWQCRNINNRIGFVPNTILQVLGYDTCRSLIAANTSSSAGPTRRHNGHPDDKIGINVNLITNSSTEPRLNSNFTNSTDNLSNPPAGGVFTGKPRFASHQPYNSSQSLSTFAKENERLRMNGGGMISDAGTPDYIKQRIGKQGEFRYF